MVGLFITMVGGMMSSTKKLMFRDDATHGNLKLESRRGCLNVDILKKHGLNANAVPNC
jgi:hypothetical protein